MHCFTSSKARTRNEIPNENSERNFFSSKVKKNITVSRCKLCQTMSPLISENGLFMSEGNIHFSRCVGRPPLLHLLGSANVSMFSRTSRCGKTLLETR